MTDITIGQMTVWPSFAHEWIIPNLRSHSTKFLGPKFAVKDAILQLKIIPKRAGNFQLSLRNSTRKSLKATLLKIDIVHRNGREKTICLKEQVEFAENQKYLDPNEPDAIIWNNLPKAFYLPGGELRLRCRIEVKRDEKDVSIAAPISSPTIVNDLQRWCQRSTIGNVMAFTDARLVRLGCLFPRNLYL